jgi:hypothetical protein
MDEIKVMDDSKGSSKEVEKTVRTKRKEFEDGSYEEIRVEDVEGGFIKTVCTRKKVEGEWEYKDEKSVSTEDPLKDGSSEGIASRLASVLKNLG